MKFKFITLLTAVAFLTSCNVKSEKDAASAAITLNGTWQLVSGTTITKGVSEFTDYTKDQRMIKIINDTHFAFLKHSLNTQKDTANIFDAGGGSYTLKGDQYTEHLDYYKDKAWEGKSFNFTVTIKNDTLIQQGLEKVEKAGIERTIIERYIKVK
jgi:hypothetical protein